MPVRTTVYLDEAVLDRVRQFVPPRGLSRLINQVLAERAEALERKGLEEQMIQGYKASWTEQSDVDDDWRPIEIQGWPD